MLTNYPLSRKHIPLQSLQWYICNDIKTIKRFVLICTKYPLPQASKNDPVDLIAEAYGSPPPPTQFILYIYRALASRIT